MGEVMVFIKRYGALLFALLFFGVLYLSGYPKPMVDDLFYTGATLNMAAGNDFSNPLLIRQNFPSHFFFVYPPLHSYALLIWLKAFGLSPFTMTGFAIVCQLLIALSAILILRTRHDLSWWQWTIPFGVCTAFMPTGLRPEPFSAALIMIGVCLFCLAGPRHFVVALSLLLILLGVSAAPRMSPFGIVFAAIILWQHFQTKRSLATTFGILMTVLAVVALLNLLMINFKIGEFFNCFTMHAKRVDTQKLRRTVGYFNENPYLTNSQLPLIFILIGLCVFAWPRQKASHATISIATVLAIILAAFAGILGAGSLWFIVFAAVLIAGLATIEPMSQGIRIKALVIASLLLANTNLVFDLWGRLGGKIVFRDMGTRAAALDAISTSGRPVLIDAATARYLLSYRIPTNCLDIEFSAPFPKSHIVHEPLKGDLYVVGPDNIKVLKDSSLLDIVAPTWAPLGIPTCQINKFPMFNYIVQAEDCKQRSLALPIYGVGHP